ncbi:O-antigen ligase family protein [Leucobacter sp. USHLN154]|uniref:O-antigen ligase family protein n=1 Tax=Leucobacter sp. USHLN154 TaxID=3081269 RepID=UPI00301A45D1
MQKYRVSTKTWLALLGVWAVLGLPQPTFVPGNIVIATGILLSALTLLSHFREVRILPVPLFLVALALLSPLWGGESESFAKVFIFCLSTCSALVFASYLSPREAISIVNAGCHIVVMITVVMVVVSPHLAFDQRWPNAGTLSGPFPHKNILGSVLVVGVLTSILMRRGRFAAIRMVSWMAVYGVLLAMAQSSSALALAAFAAVSSWVLMRWSRADAGSRHLSAFLAPVLVGSVLVIAWFNQSFFLGLFGKDVGLSGRDRIWRSTIVAWEERPWLGYGWSTAYDESSISANIIQSATGWFVPSSHNGYLSMLLQLGVIGAIALVFFSAHCLFRSLRTMVMTPSRERIWIFMVVALFALNNVIDSRLDSINWFLVVCAAVWLKKRKQEREPYQAAISHSYSAPPQKRSRAVVRQNSSPRIRARSI